MVVPRSPARWALILLVTGLVGIAAAIALWWPGAPAGTRPASATVVEPASCGSADAYDRVEFELDGEVRTARLDGCGHQENEVVDIVLPADTGGEFTVQAAASAPAGMPLEIRLAATLLCLSGLAGGLYAHLLTRRSQPTAAVVAA
ncbi:hypothetical protein [Saccharothrix lopnurensis]|uniref:Uncharacterized protein n=1 Tax=Saccharothrix lopnurensis TaxID=1670621 RepID=A0ABW1PF52_9PSEU